MVATSLWPPWTKERKCEVVQKATAGVQARVDGDTSQVAAEMKWRNALRICNQQDLVVLLDRRVSKGEVSRFLARAIGWLGVRATERWERQLVGVNRAVLVLRRCSWRCMRNMEVKMLPRQLERSLGLNKEVWIENGNLGVPVLN